MEHYNIFLKENFMNVSSEEFLMFSEIHRRQSFQNWPFDDSSPCNPKTTTMDAQTNLINVDSMLTMGELLEVGPIKQIRFNCVPEEGTLEAEQTSTQKSQTTILNAFTVLMSGEKCLVPQKRAREGRDLNRKEELYNDLIKDFEKRRLYFHRDSVDDEGSYIVQLAAAGFYHIPTNNEPDAVRCFCCYKELDGWEPEDDPWDEHKKHSSKCYFLTAKKDVPDLTMEEFIKLISERTTHKIEKLMHAKAEEFRTQSLKVREELKKLGK